MSSFLEKVLEADLRRAGIPFEREVRFDAKRKFRLDFVLPRKVAVEVDGGQWVNGRHQRGSSADRECTKGNLAILHGYRVLHFTGDMVRRGEVVPIIRKLLDDDHEKE